MQQHALSEGLVVAMEEWAAKQPAALPDALEAVERISELLDLSGLFSALLLHPRRDRKSLSYTGGIRVSGLDFGFPCPYGALESYLTKDGCRVMTRHPGDDLWAQTLTSIQGRRSMNGRVFSSPVAGFSMTHISGSKCSMISRALSTSASPSSSRRGRIVRARLYSTMSKCPGGNSA